jgi:hypothetical protein
MFMPCHLQCYHLKYLPIHICYLFAIYKEFISFQELMYMHIGHWLHSVLSPKFGTQEIMQPILTFSCTIIRDAMVEDFSKRMPALFGVHSNSSRLNYGFLSHPKKSGSSVSLEVIVHQVKNNWIYTSTLLCVIIACKCLRRST